MCTILYKMTVEKNNADKNTLFMNHIKENFKIVEYKSY